MSGEERSLEGILPHLGGGVERVGVGDIVDAGTEMRVLVLRRLKGHAQSLSRQKYCCLARVASDLR